MDRVLCSTTFLEAILRCFRALHDNCTRSLLSKAIIAGRYDLTRNENKDGCTFFACDVTWPDTCIVDEAVFRWCTCKEGNDWWAKSASRQARGPWVEKRQGG
ncbi:hypothetical protein NDU88_003688 [Pleurodeles waltl]|uniref:Uncharacterized protein n=1 Tax=Pleurodeles waltl TaxID=8319 RepID=A0AAV7WPR9_PLEWA|nr:hypothetical protein NDU88_003688 [Pleurodeles waltl]